MDDSQSVLVAISPSLLESIDFNKPLDPVFDLGMADLISLEYEESVKQYKAKRKQEKENEPPSKSSRWFVETFKTATFLLTFNFWVACDAIVIM